MLDELCVFREDEVDKGGVIDFFLETIRVEVEFDVIFLEGEEVFIEKSGEVSFFDVGFTSGNPREERFWTEVVAFCERFLVNLDTFFGLDHELHHFEEGVDELVFGCG